MEINVSSSRQTRGLYSVPPQRTSSWSVRVIFPHSWGVFIAAIQKEQVESEVAQKYVMWDGYFSREMHPTTLVPSTHLVWVMSHSGVK